MKEAQSEIKANIVVNTGDPLGGTNAGLNEIADKDESAKKREPRIDIVNLANIGLVL